MKKGIVTVFCLLALTISAIPAGAQTRGRYRYYDGSRRYEQRVQQYRYQNQVYGNRRWDRNRSFWEEHRDKITTGIGAGAGAVLGGLAGGKKGAIIGSLLGGGGAALYTYKIRDNRRRRY